LSAHFLHVAAYLQLHSAIRQRKKKKLEQRVGKPVGFEFGTSWLEQQQQSIPNPKGWDFSPNDHWVGVFLGK